MSFKISKRTVDALEPLDQDKVYYDDALKGFGVRVRKSGRKTYFVMGRFEGRQRRITIGTHGPVTADQARKQAREILFDFAKGANPTQERDETKNAPKMVDLCARFLDEYVPNHCKASTAAEYKRSVEIFILPVLKRKLVRKITRQDISALHSDLSKTPYQANRTLGVLSVMFAQAEIWGMRDEFTNPCRGVKKFKEEKRERFLSANEIKDLGDALKEEEEFAPSAVACIRLLILTGCRLSEIQKLEWKNVDLTHQMIHLPDSKTGKKTIYLGKAAVQQFEKIEKIPGNPYVITGRIDGQYLTDMQKPWRRIRKAAAIEDVRLHDLRHTFASNGIAIGEGLPVIGDLLGHSQPQTTSRYTHLANHHAIAAADRISEEIAKGLI